MARFKNSAVIFDLDGVLCNNAAELDLYVRLNDPDDSGAYEQWKDWYATFHTYDSHPEYITLARLMHDAGHKVVILTARPRLLHEVTSAWLDVHLPFGWERLVMWNQAVPWKHSKIEAIEELVDEFNVRLAIDDSERWVKVFREHGIPTLYVNHQLISVVT